VGQPGVVRRTNSEARGAPALNGHCRAPLLERLSVAGREHRAAWGRPPVLLTWRHRLAHVACIAAEVAATATMHYTQAE